MGGGGGGGECTKYLHCTCIHVFIIGKARTFLCQRKGVCRNSGKHIGTREGEGKGGSSSVIHVIEEKWDGGGRNLVGREQLNTKVCGGGPREGCSPSLICTTFL